jgi:hypothetical protein
MLRSTRSVTHGRRRPGPAVLVVLAWVFWLPHWSLAFLLVTLVAWLVLHHRLEAGPGDRLGGLWRRVWPPGSLALLALLGASVLVFVLADAPATAKVVPIGLDVLALSMILFGHWWSLFTLPRWLGGPAPPRVRASAAPGMDALTTKGETT